MLDRAYGALVGLACGDASVPPWSSCGPVPARPAGACPEPSCQLAFLEMLQETAVTSEFAAAERRRAVGWKARTPTLPEEARAPAPYVRDSTPRGLYSFCLPPAYATWNLLPEARSAALAYFADESIAWHQPTEVGPTNHLLSSQVQCVNALMPMDTDT